MPNKFTPALDAVESTNTSVYFFDDIFGEWTATSKQLAKWQHLSTKGVTNSRFSPEEKQLFWCFIAELSDQDLQECFPELFSDMY